MAKFKTYNKGYIGQKFANVNDIYAGRGGLHTGVDTKLGWDKPVVTDNTAFVYKVITSDISKENWQGVYMIVPHKDHFIEICQGHFNTIKVKEGEEIPEGAVIGLEGNKGFVFSGGKQVTIAMQKAGSKDGTHTHTSYRPVKRVKNVSRSEYYLLTHKGTKYKDRYGCYYQIIHKDNGIKGYVDPFNYRDEDDYKEKLSLLAQLVPWVKKRLLS